MESTHTHTSVATPNGDGDLAAGVYGPQYVTVFYAHAIVIEMLTGATSRKMCTLRARSQTLRVGCDIHADSAMDGRP